MHRLSRHDARGLQLDAPTMGSLDRSLAVDRIPKGIDHPAEQGLADAHFDDASRAAHEVALAQVAGLTHERYADVVFLEVQDHSRNVPGKEHELAGHRLLEAIDPRDAIAHGKHGACFRDVDLAAVLLDLAL